MVAAGPWQTDDVTAPARHRAHGTTVDNERCSDQLSVRRVTRAHRPGRRPPAPRRVRRQPRALASWKASRRHNEATPFQGMAHRCHLQTHSLPMLTHPCGLAVPRPRVAPSRLARACHRRPRTLLVDFLPPPVVTASLTSWRHRVDCPAAPTFVEHVLTASRTGMASLWISFSAALSDRGAGRPLAARSRQVGCGT